MDLGHIHGFPAWEGEVFELLKANFGEIQAIFAQYAKGDADGSAKAGMTMAQTEVCSSHRTHAPPLSLDARTRPPMVVQWRTTVASFKASPGLLIAISRSPNPKPP